MRFKLLLFTLLCSLAALLPAKAETLTVYDGTTTNNHVPAYVYYWDNFARSEVVIPASALEDMNGGTITAITFYTTQTSALTTKAAADVYLKEVSYTSISAYETKASSTIVYQGKLTISENGETTITFISPYTYGGGNLLIGTENQSNDGWNNIYFYGQTVTGASIAGSNSSSAASAPATQQNFIPKTTFTYTPSAGPVYYSPKNLTVSNIGSNEATATWTPGGDETSWNVEYKKSSDASWTSAGAVSTPTIVLDALANGTNYEVRVQGNYGSGNLSGWATTSFMTLMCDPEDMGEISYHLEDSYGDGWNNAAIQILDPNGNVVETLTILHPSSTNTDNLAEGTVSLCYNVEYTFRWVAGNFPSECSFVITDPDGEVIYEVAQGSAPSSSQDLTTYTLLKETSPKPTNLTVSHITTNSANASWTGNDDAQSYNLRYREIVKGLVSDFEDSSLGGWTTIDADGDGYNWVLGSAVGGIYLATDASLAGSGHSPQDLVVSGSYSNISGVGALNPDNYLVSPKVQLGGTITFWAKGQDSSYPSEVFGVAVSTTGNTNPSDFTMVGANKTATAAWVQYTFDLSDFSGEGYVAIRHYNCTNQFILDVDDIVISDPQSEDDWVIVNNIDATNYNITGLTPITEYEVQVQAVYADGSSDWTNSVNFTTTDGLDMPTNLAIGEITHNSAVATWEGTQDSYNLRYRTPAKADVNFFEGFENGIDAWTLVNTDGDSYNWQVVDPETAFSNSSLPRFEGTQCVMSRSYAGAALNPDQWMISPEIENLGGMLRYYVMDDGADYQETYRIYVCTTGSTDIADFVPVTDDMLTPNSAAWTEQAVDLSAYAGQNGRIAFRHYNCTDQDFMFIDAIGIYANEVPAGEWVTVNNVTSPYTIEGLDPETEYEVQVQGIFGENTTEWTESVLFTTLEAPAEMTLAELCTSGVDGTVRISNTNGLLGVYRQGTSIWFKDENGEAVDKQTPGANDKDYTIVDENNNTTSQMDFDQSNWIEVVFPEAVTYTDAYVKNLTGTFSNENGNPKLVLTQAVKENDVIELTNTNLSNAYTPNPYMAANFVGSQQGYFFSTPKAQEYAKIIWAVWDGTKMNQTSNSYGFTGSFTIDPSLNSKDFGSLQIGEAYDFHAIIRKMSGSKAAGDVYKVYPTDLDGEVTTSINIVGGNAIHGEVVGVEYVNSLGMTSKTPFQGVNIVVTRYSDGSATTVKKVFK